MANTDLIQADKHLFLNEGLAGSITQIFFDTRCKWGVGGERAVNGNLRKMSANLIGYVGAIMHGAILEYDDEGGVRKGELSQAAVEGNRFESMSVI